MIQKSLLQIKGTRCMQSTKQLKPFKPTTATTGALVSP